METPKHIVVSRSDNIGDVVLTLPLVAKLKHLYPDCKISFLARNYVRDVIKICPDVHSFISYDHLMDLSEQAAAAYLRSLKIDTFIHAFPRKPLARLAKKANIKNRIGTSRRLYHWLSCNHRVNFSRKKSTLHEAQLNMKLLNAFGSDDDYDLPTLAKMIHLTPSSSIDPSVTPLLDAHRKNIILHPLTNGNTKEWPLEKFSELIESLDKKTCNIIITGSDKEEQRLQALIDKHPSVKSAVGKLSLAQFINLISHSQAMVVNSTGPMHIAAALGIKTIGLFPPEKGKDPCRWQALGEQASFIVADECEACQNNTKPCRCMESIVVDKINDSLRN